MANWTRQIPHTAQQVARSFWPGPLTIILRRAEKVSDTVTGGQDTVALRVPSHPVAQQLLRRFGGGVAAPSANRFGRVSATTAEHVRREFGGAVECVLDGGEADLGLESTILDLSGNAPRLLRPGWISARAVEDAIGRKLVTPDATAPRAPGTLATHYAPQTPLMLVEEDLAMELAASLVRQGRRVAVLAFSDKRPLVEGLTWLAASPGVAAYAHELYANLRALDDAGCDTILVERPPQGVEWTAVNDRLRRAAGGAPAAEET